MTTATDGSIETIRRSLELLHEPGQVFEVRIPAAPGHNGYTSTASGYFNDFDLAAEAIATWDAQEPPGIYVTLNPANPALLARANNRIISRAKHTTADADIVRRRWLFFDVDADRPSGIAATDDELDLALTLAADIEDVLRGRGWPYPMHASSGNGCYLLYRLDLPNDAESLAMVNACYAAVNAMLLPHYDPARPHAKLDTTVGNAARIIRVGGTVNRKGDPTPDRPHRICTYHAPDPDYPLEVVR